MELPDYFRESLPALRSLVEQNDLHEGVGPVCLTKTLARLEIKVCYLKLPKSNTYDTLISSKGYVAKPPVIFINTSSSSAIQRRSVARNLATIIAYQLNLIQPTENPQIHDYSKKNAEKDWGAAFLLVPLGSILASFFQQQTLEQVAVELDVPPELVYLRLEMADELGELDGWKYVNELAS